MTKPTGPIQTPIPNVSVPVDWSTIRERHVSAYCLKVPLKVRESCPVHVVVPPRPNRPVSPMNNRLSPNLVVPPLLGAQWKPVKQTNQSEAVAHVSHDPNRLWSVWSLAIRPVSATDTSDACLLFAFHKHVVVVITKRQAEHAAKLASAFGDDKASLAVDETRKPMAKAGIYLVHRNRGISLSFLPTITARPMESSTRFVPVKRGPRQVPFTGVASLRLAVNVHLGIVANDVFGWLSHDQTALGIRLFRNRRESSTAAHAQTGRIGTWTGIVWSRHLGAPNAEMLRPVGADTPPVFSLPQFYQNPRNHAEIAA